MNRIFTIVDFPKDGKTYGKYIGKTPGRAAYKAFSKLSRMIDLKNSDQKKFLVFVIEDITPNSKNKQYKYIGTRVELNEPIIIDRDGKKISYKFKNIITSYTNFINN